MPNQNVPTNANGYSSIRNLFLFLTGFLECWELLAACWWSVSTDIWCGITDGASPEAFCVSGSSNATGGRSDSGSCTFVLVAISSALGLKLEISFSFGYSFPADKYFTSDVLTCLLHCAAKESEVAQVATKFHPPLPSRNRMRPSLYSFFSFNNVQEGGRFVDPVFTFWHAVDYSRCRIGKAYKQCLPALHQQHASVAARERKDLWQGSRA